MTIITVSPATFTRFIAAQLSKMTRLETEALFVAQTCTCTVKNMNETEHTALLYWFLFWLFWSYPR